MKKSLLLTGLVCMASLCLGGSKVLAAEDETLISDFTHFQSEILDSSSTEIKESFDDNGKEISILTTTEKLPQIERGFGNDDTFTVETKSMVIGMSKEELLRARGGGAVENYKTHAYGGITVRTEYTSKRIGYKDYYGMTYVKMKVIEAPSCGSDTYKVYGNQWGGNLSSGFVNLTDSYSVPTVPGSWRSVYFNWTGERQVVGNDGGNVSGVVGIASAYLRKGGSSAYLDVSARAL